MEAGTVLKKDPVATDKCKSALNLKNKKHLFVLFIFIISKKELCFILIFQ